MYLVSLSLFLYLFELGPYSVAQATLKFVAVFFPQPPEYRDYTQMGEFGVLFCLHESVCINITVHFGCICMKDALLILVGDNLFAGLSFMGHNLNFNVLPF